MDSLTFQTRINTQLATLLVEQSAHYRALGGTPEIVGYLEHLQAVTAGGKRVRPYLTWSLLSHYAPDEQFLNHSLLLVSLELFHVFCLVHDDVMDEADFRHGTQTMHTYAAKNLYTAVKEPQRTRISDSQAILSGDILFNTVFKLFYQYIFTVEPTKAKLLSESFHTLVDEVCLGQMIDIDLTTKDQPAAEAIILKNILKTARYSFVQPLSLGAIVAGRRELLPFLSDFGEKLGLLYQIQDDILDITGDSEKTKKPLFQDVTQKQPTILSQHIQSVNNEYKIMFNTYLGKPIPETAYADLRNIFEASGALEKAQGMIGHIEKELRVLFNTHQISETDQTFFAQLMELIHNRNH